MTGLACESQLTREVGRVFSHSGAWCS